MKRNRSCYSSGLIILGGRWGNARGSVGRWSMVQALRIVVTRLITIAPPTAGQNPVTENPLTRYAVSSRRSALTTMRKSPSERTIKGRVSTKRMGRTNRFRNVSTRTAASPARKRVDFKAGHDHDGQEYRDARDQDSNDRRAKPAAKEIVVELPCDVNRRHRSPY